MLLTKKNIINNIFFNIYDLFTYTNTLLKIDIKI